MASCQFEAACEHAEFPVFERVEGFLGACGLPGAFFGAVFIGGMELILIDQYLCFLSQEHPFFLGAALAGAFFMDADAFGAAFLAMSEPHRNVRVNGCVVSGRTQRRLHTDCHRGNRICCH